jgi:hypothetical protein
MESSERLMRTWSAEAPSPARMRQMATVARVRDRRARAVAGVELALAFGVLALVAIALGHAAPRHDLVRGGLAVATVLAILVARARRRHHGGASWASTRTFLVTERRRLDAQRRSLHTIWLLDAAALLFHLPWMLDGYRIHGELLGPEAFLTGWLPLLVMVAIAVWSVRAVRSVQRQTQSLAALLAQDDDA